MQTFCFSIGNLKNRKCVGSFFFCFFFWLFWSFKIKIGQLKHFLIKTKDKWKQCLILYINIYTGWWLKHWWRCLTWKVLKRSINQRKKKFQGTQVYSAIIGKSNILNKLSKWQKQDFSLTIVSWFFFHSEVSELIL